MNGYASRAYALTCTHVGMPRVLPRSGVTVLVRPVAASPGTFDACAPYPLLSTERWEEFAADLAEQNGLVSFVGVVDPLSAPPVAQLETLFPDHLLAFKSHHVARLEATRPLAHVAVSHLRKARRAAEALQIEVAEDPGACATDWVRLYGTLRRRHGLSAAADFPAAALAAQLSLNGMVAVLARQQRRIVSMSLWLVNGRRAHYHLGASDERGYQAAASFATFACAFEALAERGVEYVDLGGAAGLRDTGDGLARFKQGWASELRPAWLGGRVLDGVRYAQLCESRGAAGFFPGYRAKVAA